MAQMGANFNLSMIKDSRIGFPKSRSDPQQAAERTRKKFSVACSVKPTNLSYDTLPFKDSLFMSPSDLEDIDIQKEAEFHGYVLTDFASYNVSLRYTHSGYFPTNIFKGIVTTGAIFIDEIFRQHGGPYSSEILKAVYQKYYPIRSLKQIFCINVLNNTTMDLSKETSNEDSEDQVPAATRVHQFGTEKYFAIMSSSLGKMVTCLLLQAFGTGARRISKITIRKEGIQVGSHIVFDIQSIARGR